MSILNKIVLGVSDTHDASAAIVHNGRLVCAVAEERVQRVKSVGGFPKGAIDACLKHAGLKYADIDLVAVAGDRAVPVNMLGTTSSLSLQDFVTIQEELRYPRYYEQRSVSYSDVFPNFAPKGNPYYSMAEVPLKESAELAPAEANRVARYRLEFIAKQIGIDIGKVSTIDHHTCHAYFAYYASKTRDRPVVAATLDSGGDGAYETVSTFDERGAFKQLHRGHNCILGPVYSMVTLLLRMRPFEHEFKVMGLAPYAKEHVKAVSRSVFRSLLEPDGIGFKKSATLKDYYFHVAEMVKYERFDGIAGGLQDWAEELLTAWITNIVDFTGIGDVVFSGGVALNVKANYQLAKINRLTSLFVPPGSGDESLSIGAIWALLDRINPDGDHRSGIQSMENGYLGPRISDGEIAEFANHQAVLGRFKRIQCEPNQFAAEALHRGEVVAICRDQMEFGPRALGNRSLIANPSSINSVKKINEAIKGRDFWMPFAPAILSEQLNDYVSGTDKCDMSFMTFCADSTQRGATDFVAAMHPYDKTLRVQSVRKTACPGFHELISRYHAISGIPGVLNTSLNIHGKPIVMKPVDIANELLTDPNVDIQTLVIGNAVFERADKPIAGN